MNSGQPYWDGDKWITPSANSSVLAAGWVLAILFPIAGFAIGLSQINRSREGLWIVLLSVGSFAFWLAALSDGL